MVPLVLGYMIALIVIASSDRGEDTGRQKSAPGVAETGQQTKPGQQTRQGQQNITTPDDTTDMSHDQQ